jgi:hypothetical protein
MSFTFARLAWCLRIFSVAVWDRLDRRAVDEDDWNPLVDEAYAPMDMTFSSIRSIRISSIEFSTVLRSSDMHVLYQISRVGGKTLEVSKTGGEVSIRTV